MSPKKAKPTRPVHKYLVTITPDEDMDLDDFDVVRGLIEEAIRDSGMDNGCDVKVEGVDR